MAADYYALLGVGRNATDDEIRRAFRRLARELHPDASGGDPVGEERFKEVQEAYEVLRDPERRRLYDMYGPEAARRGAGPGPEAADVFGGGLGDLFNAFFGGQSPFGARRPGGPAAMRGNDLEVKVELSFEEAVFGTDKTAKLRLPVTCSTCKGSGARPGTTAASCSTCKGTGELRRVRQSLLGQMVTASPCPQCGGAGEVASSPCPDCRGEGRRTEERELVVPVPAGVDDGAVLQMPGHGAAGPRGGPPGDLLVHLSVRPHPSFERHGYDLVHVLHLPMTKAALGARVPLPTLEGEEELVVPAGTQGGQTFVKRGRGVPHVHARARGDLIVQVVVDVPTDLTSGQELLLRQLAAERGEDVEAASEPGLLGKLRSALR